MLPFLFCWMCHEGKDCIFGLFKNNLYKFFWLKTAQVLYGSNMWSRSKEKDTQGIKQKKINNVNSLMSCNYASLSVIWWLILEFWWLIIRSLVCQSCILLNTSIQLSVCPRQQLVEVISSKLWNHRFVYLSRALFFIWLLF